MDYESHAAEHNGMGALITSGLGKDSRRPIQFYLVLLALAIVPIGAGYFLAVQFGYRTVEGVGLLAFHSHVRTNFYYIFIAGGIVLAAVSANIAILIARKFAQTEVHVHETGIKGMGFCGPERIMTLKPFSLSHSQIITANADMVAWAGKCVVIAAEGKVYIAYPPNPEEIVAAIAQIKDGGPQ